MNWILVALFSFAVVNSIFALMTFLSPGTIAVINGANIGGNPPSWLTTIRIVTTNSPVLAPIGWVLFAGVWVWRGRVKSQWERLGFDSDTFRLFMKMRGGPTRAKLLSALDKPKDRFRLATDLGMDWRAVDQQMVVLGRHGLVIDRVAYGKVRMYELTASGRRLLELLDDTGTEVKAGPESASEVLEESDETVAIDSQSQS